MDREEKIEEMLRKFWGLLPLLVVLLYVALVAAIQALTGDTLRSVPRMVLTCMGLCSIVVALLWANIQLLRAEIPIRLLGILLKIAVPILSCVLVVYMMGIGVLSLVFSYRPEHVVMYRGEKMVASVNSFVDVWVDYYQYKNPLFYGKKMAEEWYGSGGYDPFERPDMPSVKGWTIYDTQGNVVEWGP